MSSVDILNFLVLFMKLLVVAKAWQQSAILDDAGLISFYWTVDVKKNVLLFEIQAQTTGYIGFGISPDGTMSRADIMVGYVDNEGNPQVMDYWAEENGALKSEVSQDWNLLTGRQNGSHTMLRVRRELIPSDTRDAPIHNTATWIIWAWHPNDPLGDSMPPYHTKARRGAKLLCIISTDCSKSIELPNSQGCSVCPHWLTLGIVALAFPRISWPWPF